jgi:hypothetical protein
MENKLPSIRAQSEVRALRFPLLVEQTFGALDLHLGAWTMRQYWRRYLAQLLDAATWRSGLGSRAVMARQTAHQTQFFSEFAIDRVVSGISLTAGRFRNKKI